MDKQKPIDVNPAQWQAITHPSKHLLIVAGPGTGKTHTLTRRISFFCQKFNAPEKILAITFTNKAAEQMKERLHELLGDGANRIFVGTIHSFCLHILRKYIQETALPPGFRILSAQEQEILLKNLWPQKTAAQRRDILSAISRWKAIDFDQDPSPEIQEYNKHLRQHHLLDFDDLLKEAYNLITSSDKIGALIRENYPYVFVDEYQDINPVQHALIKALVDPDVYLSVIGDPNQSIYGFRGSDVKLFHLFEKDFSDAVVLGLEENYRSAATLLLASGQVIVHGQNAPHQVPALIAKFHSQGHLMIYEAPTDKAEAEYVVHQIEKMIGGTTMFSHDSHRVKTDDNHERSFADFAVLYRLNHQNHLLKEAFERSGIPYQVSGETSLLEQPGVAEVIDSLKLFCGQKVDLLDCVRPALKKHTNISDENQNKILALTKQFNCLEGFLDHFVLQRPEDMISFRAEKVSLLTLHAAKGLEFPVVFIVGCEEDLLPLRLEGLSSDIEEERRLFYVGMTRAKEKLYLARAKRRCVYGQTRENPPSRFLSDIEDSLKQYDQSERSLSQRKSKTTESDQMDLFS